jgi:hypothetical protein
VIRPEPLQHFVVMVIAAMRQNWNDSPPEGVGFWFFKQQAALHLQSLAEA